MTPASWRDLLAQANHDVADLVRMVTDEVAKDLSRGTLLLFDEFALDVQLVGAEHRLGLYAATDAPSWVTEEFARGLLRAVHEKLAPHATCTCEREFVIVFDNGACN